MKVYSWSKPRKIKGEVNTLPSMTDQLADEPIQSIIERFQCAGVSLTIPSNFDGVIINNADDLESAFSQPVVDTLDKVEQLDALATAERLVEQLRQESNKAPKSAQVSTVAVQTDTQTSDVKKQQDEPKLA